MTPEDRAGRDLPSLQGNLHALIALSEAAFPVNIGRRSHLQFMLASFAIKQHEHAKSVLKLGMSLDTTLIARSMLEGLSQLLWAMKQPGRRPLMWRAFGCVVDWRLLQHQRAEGYAIDSRVERDIRARLRRYDHWFLTKTAREARMVGHALPVDPYVRNWYSERETEIFRDVEGDKLLEYAYGPFSEWHH
jgi:hypothetical protein